MFRQKLRESEAKAKSLNFVVRKRENDRIERDNLAFAKRLLVQPPSLNKKTMDEEYEQHVQYKDMILRVPQMK